jgi:hypothetical protein
VNGFHWLLILGGLALAAWATWRLLVRWRQAIRRRKQIAEAVQAVKAAMGKHSLLESEDRTEPLPVLDEALALLEAGLPQDEVEAVPHVTVAELVERIARAGLPLRLNWRAEDEQEAADAAGVHAPDEFPTAVLPVVADEDG